MALLDTTLGLLGNQNFNYFLNETAPKRMGNAHASIVPYQVFATADGHMILAAGNDRQFKAFTVVSGDSHLSADPKFATNPERVKNRDELIPLVAEIMARKTTSEWIKLLEEASVPCGPINTIEQAFEDPQIVERGLKFDLPHPLSGSVPQVANPIKFSGTPMEYEAPAPLRGQHTNEILEGLGISDSEIARLKDRGTVD